MIRFLSWNCKQAFHQKLPLLESLNPDIAVIQACEAPENIASDRICQQLWIGENPKNGVGIFSFNPKIELELIPYDFENNYWFCPVRTNVDFSFLAV